MGRILKLRVRNYRSIKDAVEVDFPKDSPLVLVGSNNAGKSNLIRALDLVLGESWPGSFEPDDHDFFNRDKGNKPIEVTIDVEGVHHTDRYEYDHEVGSFVFRYPPNDEQVLQMVYRDGTVRGYVSNDTREQCLCIVIGADRRLSYQLSYVSKYTFLSKLMRRFHAALTSDAARVTKLQTKFEETKVVFQEVTEFKTFSEELKARVGELAGNFEYELGIDFSAYDPSNFFHALKVHPRQGDQVRTFAELGTGQEQVLAIAFAYAYAKAFHGEDKGLVLVIEEPEAHLHPLAQKWVAQKVHELAKAGVQVVITTHSPAFVNVMNLAGLALVRKTGAATQIVQQSAAELSTYCRGKGATKATSDSILPFYAAATTDEILSGFFARRIVLVEGPTEAFSVPVYLHKMGFDPEKEGVAVIPVHGVGSLAKWWRLFSAYGVPTYVIFDNDASDDPSRKKRADLLTTLAVNASDHAAVFGATSLLVKDGYAVCGENFEKTMLTLFGSAYTLLEEEAKTKFGLSLNQSKPLVARYVAERVSIPDGSEANDTLRALKDKISALSG